jgi:hypothetical protein
MRNKFEFARKFAHMQTENLNHRKNLLEHRFNCALLARGNNQSIEFSQNKPKKRVKCKSGSNPSKARTILNEPVDLSLEEIRKLRIESRQIFEKQMNKINSKYKEKSKELMLPFIVKQQTL